MKWIRSALWLIAWLLVKPIITGRIAKGIRDHGKDEYVRECGELVNNE